MWQLHALPTPPQARSNVEFLVQLLDLPCHWVFVLILRLSWHLFLSQDSDSEDEKGEGVDMFSDGQRSRRPSPKRNGLQTARDASPDEEPLEPRTEEFRFRTAEERQQELVTNRSRLPLFVVLALDVLGPLQKTPYFVSAYDVLRPKPWLARSNCERVRKHV